MSVEEELAKFSPGKDMLLTIGVFDGVHLGHKYLISQLIEHARKQDLLSGVVTFYQHPQEVLSPQTRLPFLTDLKKRICLLKDEGVEDIIILSFTSELARLGARQFLSLLKKYLRMRGLVVGPDFTLGQNREGNVSRLCTLGQDMDFTVTVVPPITINDEVASSTAIRQALANGDMKRVLNLSGRPFSLRALVVPGAGRGTELGFPTANLSVDSEQALPADGIYATWAYIGDDCYPSVTSIGKRPTFDGNDRTIEVYVVDYHGDLYGCNLKFDVVERLRDEKRFDTAQELAGQIAEDVKRSKAVLLEARGRN